MRTMRALRAPTPPISGTATRNPNIARLGTVWTMLVKASNGAPSRGVRAATIPSGKPIAMAVAVAASTSTTCWAIATSISGRCESQKLNRFTGYDRNRRQRLEEHPDSRIAGPGDCVRRVERHQAPLIQHAKPGCEREGFSHVVSHHDDRLAKLSLDAPKLAVQFGPSKRVERAERLIHQEHRRVGGKGPRDPDALALSS